MIRSGFVFLAVLGLSGTARATPYWIAWEGDDYPENQGWTRDILGGGDARTLENGVMTLDGLQSGPGFVWDAYEQFRPGAMDPGPGETFVMQWRMRVNAVTDGNWDPIVYVYSDDWWAVSFEFAVDRLWSTYEGPTAQVAFAPGSFHDFELRTEDDRRYELYVDGALARVGTFVHNIPPGSWLGWGDGTGTLSSSTWDYFHYGVVPEPAGACLLVVTVVAARVCRAGALSFEEGVWTCVGRSESL